jgi:thiol-disulfide isomerase/thioredoxin
MRKSLLLIAISFLFCHAAPAQNNSKPGLLSEKVMKAELQPVDGSASIKLSALRGKIIVLVLWASWCRPCRMAVTALDDFNKDFVYRGVEVIGLTFGNSKTEVEDVLAFVRDSTPGYQLGWASREIASELLGERTTIPQILVLTDEGLIVKRFLGYNPDKTIEQLRAVVEGALINPPRKTVAAP